LFAHRIDCFILAHDCAALVAKLGGVITVEAVDIGPGPIIDLPGYARLYKAIDLAKVDAWITDMTDFGPTLILGLYAMCVVSAVEMWDLKIGRITDVHVHAAADVFNRQEGQSTESSKQLVRELLKRQLKGARGRDDDHREEFLQTLVHERPDIIPMEEIEPAFRPLISVCTELSTAAGSVDNVWVTSEGECKLIRNPQSRREVVPQPSTMRARLATRHKSSAYGRYCCKSRKLHRSAFLVKL
jgi:hypothetical protein